MSKPDGGAAFPSDPAFYGEKTGPGLSVRDYFAAAALTGWVAKWEGDEIPKANAEGAATQLYVLADAMLAERDKA
jgi:hypothetical protein